MEKDYVTPNANAGSLKKKVTFELRADSDQQLTDMVLLMTTIANKYAANHTCDATVRDHNYEPSDPSNFSRQGRAMSDKLKEIFG